MFNIRAIFVWVLPVLLAVPAVTQAETYFGYTSMGTTMNSSGTDYTATGSRIYAGMAWPIGKAFVTGAEVATMDTGTYSLSGGAITVKTSATAVNWVIGPRFGNFGLDLGVGYVPWSVDINGSVETGNSTSNFVNIKYRVFKSLSLRYEMVNYTATTSNGEAKMSKSGLGLSLDF